jgi:lathosterol oxidase
MIDWLWSISLTQATTFFLALNILILLGAFIAEKVLAHLFSAAPKRTTPDRLELVLASSTIAINALISVAGWLLWKYGHLQLNRHADGVTIVRDTLLLVLAMDFVLYLLHRIAHMRWFYNWAHYLHHEHRDVRMLTLFVMHPLEALGFGSLWVITLTLNAFSVEAVVIFLQLNLYFGLAAHCGFSPYPKWLTRILAALCIAEPGFHFGHHRNENGNLGFYTVIWDRLFGPKL